MFEGPIDLVHRYEELVEGTPGANGAATGEIILVLRQLELIITMVRERERDTRDVFVDAGQDPKAVEEASRRTFRLHDEVGLLTDAFYYFAFAIVALIKDERLPHVPPLAAKDVAVIRNVLLAHYKPDPTAPFGRVTTSGQGTGPTFAKQDRKSGAIIRTGGLFSDAEAFAFTVFDCFTRAVERATS